MGDLQKAPLFKVMTKILEEALLESGWSPHIKTRTTFHSPNSRSMGDIQEELNTEDPSVCTVNRGYIGAHPTCDWPPKKSMGDKRKERFLKEKQAEKNINNNYIYDLSDVSPNYSPSQVSPAPSQVSPASSQVSPAPSPKTRAGEIPEKKWLLVKEIAEDMPCMNLDRFKPSTTCNCGRPLKIIQCLMCGTEVVSNCFKHNPVVGNYGIRCSRPTCSSGKLIELRNM